jgi:hypothetical protein
MYDNGCYNPRVAGSYILEVNPHVEWTEVTGSGFFQTVVRHETETLWVDDRLDPPRTGILKYVDPGPTAINNTEGLVRRDQVLWAYGGNPNDFYSSYISGCTRMPNGNTIICSGAASHFFEVVEGASAGGFFGGSAPVWEYVLPPFSGGAFQPTKTSNNMCFRFYRFSADHPALAGKDLTPGLTLVEMGTGITGFDRMEDQLRDFRLGAQVVQ